MKIIRILLLLLVLSGSAYAGYFYYKNKKLPNLKDINKDQVLGTVTELLPENFQELADKLPQPDLKNSSQEATEQIKILSEKSVEIKSQIDQVIKEVVKESSDGASIQERALEYGQYLYCQQVVKEYTSP